MFVDEVKEHLLQKIIPFWKGLRDDEYGGYYGWLDHDLTLRKKAEKGAILNSRILWFFSNAYLLLQDDTLLDEANHAYEFMTKYMIDPVNGGIYWSVNYDGSPADKTKHTYNQAFAIYALSSYYEATKEEKAIVLAKDIYRIIEEKCTDEFGYKEAQSAVFETVSNEKLSENGVMADKTMNTLLHVYEAYTGLYQVTKDESVKEKLIDMLHTFIDKVYNKEKRRQEVFFDNHWNSIIDLQSYGHDIESSWLIEEGCRLLHEDSLFEQITKITSNLAECVYEKAYRDHSLMNECENGINNTYRIWWVQAEAVLGFLNQYDKYPEESKYKQAVLDLWDYIKTTMVDPRSGSEWFWQVDEHGIPDEREPIVEPWKCPYHNGRMCFKIIKRGVNFEQTI